ncbi:hypothetical protein [Herbiconiux liukaitaii]|uniref:hypothetical protein n=1 Tax=Herbiconiux liukaitaii TaxID=3342799 RepID=UPI0035B6FB18
MPRDPVRGAVAIGATLHLVARRARGDLMGLLGTVILVALTTGLAVAVPARIGDTLDSGAREAVQVGGSDTDLLLRSAIAGTNESGTTVARFLEYATEVPGRLPADLARSAAQSSTSILGPELEATRPVGEDQVRIGVADPSAGSAVRLVSGSLPAADTSETSADSPVDVVISTATAETAGVAVGDSLVAGTGQVGTTITLRVVGVAEAVDEGAETWSDLPGLWDPRLLSARGRETGAAYTVLSDATAFDRIAGRLPDVSAGTVRTAFDPALFDLRLVDRVGEALDELETSPWLMTQGAPLEVSASSGWEEALSSFPAAAGATTAQLSTLAAGLLGVSLLVTALIGSALARRRGVEIALLRSRGASIGLIGLHAAVEAVAVALLGACIGIGAATALGHQSDSLLLPIGVSLVAAAVPVVATLRQVASPRASRSRPLRIIAAAALGAVTITAIAALQVPTGTATGAQTGTAAGALDPLALAAPLLISAVVALGLSSVPAVWLRPLSALALRARGPRALLARSSAHEGRSPATLFALTLACSVAITSLVLLQTVATGQEAASWRVVGADVRIDGAPDPAALVTELTDEGAIAAAIAELDDVPMQGVGSSIDATVLAVDADYPALLAALPAGLGGSASAAVTSLLEQQPADGDEAVPALFDPRLTGVAGGETVTLDIGGTIVPVRIIGAPIALPGSSGAPLAVVDRSRLDSYLATALPDASGAPDTDIPDADIPDPDLLDPGVVLAVGAPALTVAATEAASAADADRVLIRDEVLAAARDRALVSGVTSATALSLGATGGLAALALLVTTAIGFRRRGRILALLGALGVPPRAGIWLALGELGPLVVGGVIGGAIAAAVVLAAAAPTFGAETLVGGAAPIGVPWWMPPTILGAAAAALILAVCVDLSNTRRVRTSDILRTGEDS